jgi:hypothetical protein
VQPPVRRSGAGTPNTDHTSRVALRESTAEMLLVFTVSSRAHHAADELSACFAIMSNSPKLEMRQRCSSTSLNKLSPSASKAHSDRPRPACLVQNSRGTRRMSSAYGGESTRSNTLSRPSSRIISRDDPNGSSPQTGSMTGSFPQAPLLGTQAGSPCTGPTGITR